MTTNQPDADLAAKIESALGEHVDNGVGCCSCKEFLTTHPSSKTIEEQHRAHLARDVIAPLVEAHGREAAAAAWSEGVSDADDAWKAAARLSLSGRDQIENPYRAAQHRSKP